MTIANQITAFFHCAQCIKMKPADQAPRDWIRVEVGWTSKGLQVWCVRHEINVAHIDLLGHKVRLNAEES